MGVYKRKISAGIRFYFRGQYLLVRYHSKAIYHSVSEAAKAERARRDEIDREARCPTVDMYLKSLIEDRLDYLKVKMSKDYYENNRRTFKLLLEYCGNIKVSEVTRKHINRLLIDEAEKAAEEGKTNYQINTKIRQLKALFNWGIDNYELNIKNPCQKLKFYPIDLKLKKIPTDEEINAVRAVLSLKQALLFDFVAETGCRIMEAIRLTDKDVENEYVVLYSRKAKGHNLTPRKIPRPDCLQGEFKGKVFPDWNSYPRFLEELAEGWNWHNLRHRRASKWMQDNMPIYEIMSRLGHNNLSTTQIYLQMISFTRFSREKPRSPQTL